MNQVRAGFAGRFVTRAQQLLRWATVLPQYTWAESGEGLLWGLSSLCGATVYTGETEYD